MTHNNMADFDFSAPIDVTIIYDDSDEDNLVIALTSDEDQPKCSEDASTLIEKTSNLKNKRNIETSQLGDLWNENLLKDNKKSRIEVDHTNNNSIAQNCETDIVSNSNNNTDLLPENPTICKSTNANNNLTNNTALGSVDVEVMRKEYQEARSYIHDLLTTVSKHLILVINAYEDHAKIVNECKDRVDGNLRIQDSKARYIRAKTHIFHLSYSVVLSVILTQESNHEFINEFLNNTVKIAHDENQLQYTVQYIQPFFYDLLFWTKQKRNYMNNTTANEIQKTKESNINRTPLLCKQLSQPPPPLQLIKPSRKAKKADKHKVPDRIPDQLPALSKVSAFQEQPSIPIFSSGAPDREVRISVQPNLLHIQNQQMAQITNTQHRPPPPYSHHHFSNYRRPDHHYQTHNQNQSANYNFVNNYAPSANVSAAPTVTNMNQNLNQTVHNQNKQYADQTWVQNTGWASRPCMNQASQPLPSLREFRPHQHIQNIRQEYAEIERQFLLANKNQPSYSTERCVENLQNISPKKVVESGRSVSTDSGFVSPLQFNTGGDKTHGESVEQSTQFTPLITHVTSLNPNAVQIAEGFCYVCGKATNTKCMGCYQAYYCNYRCEKADWSNHMIYCKMNTGTQ